ncbi:MAG: hypothetical protein ACAH83_15455 [Alphaproteobacteria bacterium]
MQKNNVNIPRKLVELSKFASKASYGFFVLGDMDGLHSFRESLAQKLAERGWDISTGDHRSGPDDMRRFMDEAFLYNFHPGRFPHARVRWILHVCLSEHRTPETAAFATDPKNFGTLEAAVNAALEETKARFGDPMTIKYKQKSFLKAVFDTAASKFAAETPETRLTKVFEDMARTARKYNDTIKVHPAEFRDFVSDVLAGKGWDVKNSAMRNELVWLESSARFSQTQIGIRKELQDDTLPARPIYRAAKDFMMAHSDELSAAIREVAAELDKKAVAPKTPKP